MEKNGTSRMSTTPGLARRWSSTAPPDRSAPVAARSASIAAFASSLSSPGSWNSALPTASIALIPYPRTANAIAFATRFGVSAGALAVDVLSRCLEHGPHRPLELVPVHLDAAGIV